MTQRNTGNIEQVTAYSSIEEEDNYENNNDDEETIQ
jgi:hypothetical protein